MRNLKKRYIFQSWLFYLPIIIGIWFSASLVLTNFKSRTLHPNILSVVNLFYPNLTDVIKAKPTGFLLQKINSIGIRLCVSYLLIFLISFFWNRIKEFFSADDNDLKLQKIIRYTFLALCFAYVSELVITLHGYTSIAPLYAPSGITGILFPTFPDIISLVSIVVLSHLLGLIWLMKGYNLGLLFPALILLLISSILYSFGKVDHTYTTFIFVLFCLSIPTNACNGIGLPLARFAIVCAYFFSSLEKIINSGSEWLSPFHLTQTLMAHPTIFTDTIVSMPLVVSMLSFTVVAWQFTWPIIILYKRLTAFYVGFAVIFHLLTWQLMAVGGWHTPWIAALLVFIPLLIYKRRVISN